jgi:hypothetical protein
LLVPRIAGGRSRALQGVADVVGLTTGPSRWALTGGAGATIGISPSALSQAERGTAGLSGATVIVSGVLELRIGEGTEVRHAGNAIEITTETIAS